MKKITIYIFYAFISVFIFSPLSWAYDFQKYYRTLDIYAELTKQTKSFQIKNLFPFHLPNNLPSTAVFKGVKGNFSTTTQANFNKNGQEITFSETLFSIAYSANTCPKKGELANSYQEYFAKYSPTYLTTSIVKQAQGNETKSFNVDFTIPYGIPINMTKNGCIIVVFDGTDFAAKPYTIKANLKMLYTFEPIWKSLDAEFLVNATNQIYPTLNAYSVIPVGNDPKSNIVSGTITALAGNVSATPIDEKVKGHWFIRYIMAVYKNDSCQKAFPNHSKNKFFWNSETGTKTTPNPSSVFWPTSIIVSDFTVAGTDRESLMQSISEKRNLPIHIEKGDCVVQAALPYGDNTTSNQGTLNTEFQTGFQYIPD